MSKTSIFKLQIGIILLFLVASINTYSGEEEKYHFRQTRWGMSQEDVKKAENGEPDHKLSGRSTLMWKAELLGEQVAVVYTFAYNKLVRAKYMFVKYSPLMQMAYNSTNGSPKKLLPGMVLLDYYKFEKALIEKYGKPYKQFSGAPKEVINNKSNDPEVLRKQVSMIEDAIRAKKTFWYSQWKTKDTLIILLLRGDKGEMLMEIGYSNTTLSHLENKVPL